MRKSTFAALAATTLTAAAVVSTTVAGPASADGRRLFITSAVEHAGGTATFPLHRGRSHGQTVYYLILDVSDGSTAQRLGVNESQKLANARGTAAVQHVKVNAGVVDFPATVDFRPVRQVVPGPGGFPPSVAVPGAVGEAGYSPLIEMPDGTVRNAPQIANTTGRADKLVTLDLVHMRATYRETNGFARDKAVHYVSTEASNPVAAALEDVTLAPRLDAAPAPGEDGTDVARSSLAAFVNGQTGAGNPNRQGLNSAILDGLDPLNLLRWTPNQGRYAPLWDVHLAQWTPRAIAAHLNTRQVSFDDVAALADRGLVTGPGGVPFGPSGFVVNCPIVSQLG